MKLSKTQTEVIKLMREGWALRVEAANTRLNVWLFNPDEFPRPVSYRPYRDLKEKGLVSDENELTETGKSIEL